MKYHSSVAAMYFYFLIIIISLYSVNIVGAIVRQEIKCPVQSLYQLGDSIADTGNSIKIFPVLAASRPPYGESFPGSPTGRWSDGRLIIDYIAIALGLPLLKPYLAKNPRSVLENGVNFAVAGSTALDFSFFLVRGVVPFPVPSLSVQLGWFRTYLESRHSTPAERANKLNESLVFVGETGYNDIAASIFEGRSVEETKTYVPFIVQAIITTTREVIKYGSSQVVVPGTFPLGCFPWALNVLGSQDATSYDEIGCLESLNELSASLNQQLQDDLETLRKEFPNVVILYADYYTAFHSLLRNASTLGFDTTTLFKPCCGEPTYNDVSFKFCGNDPAVSVCPNPNTYIYWDGVHLTQEVYRRMSEIIIKDLKINCTSKRWMGF